MKWLVYIYYTDFKNCLFIKYKDEYQKSKWTIEYRIFISFIWSRSELSKCYNDNVFTKKLIFATYIGMSRFPQPYLLQFFRSLRKKLLETVQIAFFKLGVHRSLILKIFCLKSGYNFIQRIYLLVPNNKTERTRSDFLTVYHIREFLSWIPNFLSFYKLGF